MVRDVCVNATEHLTVKACHVIGSERRPESDRLVENAAKRPDIALHVVRLIAPDLWTRIVGRSCLGVQKSSLRNFADIHVSKFCRSIFLQKYVGAFEITMENVCVMQRLESFDHLDEDAPDVLLAQVCLLLLMAGDFLEKIAIVCILHDNAVQD